MRHPEAPYEHWDARNYAGALIKQARRLSGLSISELARRSGTSKALISNYEHGVKQPTLPMLMRLFTAAGLEPRVTLVPLDPHDAVLAERLAS